MFRKVKVTSYWSLVGPNSSDWSPYKRSTFAQTHTGKTPCEEGGRDRGGASIEPGTSKQAAKAPEVSGTAGTGAPVASAGSHLPTPGCQRQCVSAELGVAAPAN